MQRVCLEPEKHISKIATTGAQENPTTAYDEEITEAWCASEAKVVIWSTEM